MKDKKWRFYITFTWKGVFKLIGVIFLGWILYVFLSIAFLQRKVLGKSSDSVAESKINGTYLWRYRVDSTVYYDTLRLHVREVFAERIYYYKDHYTFKYKINYNSSCVMIMFDNLEEIKDSVLSIYCFWGKDQKKYIYYNTKRYKQNYYSFTSPFPPDTLELKIFWDKYKEETVLQELRIVREDKGSDNHFPYPEDNFKETTMRIP